MNGSAVLTARFLTECFVIYLKNKHDITKTPLISNLFGELSSSTPFLG